MEGSSTLATPRDLAEQVAQLDGHDRTQFETAERLLRAKSMSTEEIAASTGLLSKRVDLGALLREGIPPVEYLPGELARRMAYKVGVTGFSGHPESGKTTLVC